MFFSLLKRVEITEIRIDDLLVIHYFIGPAIRDLLAVIEHHDTVGDPHDNTHDVLNDEYGSSLVPDLPYQLHGLVALLRVEPGSEFIEKQEFRAGCKSPGKLQALEFKQMTSVMSQKDERQLIDRMKAIQKEIKEINILLEKDAEIISLGDEMRAAYNEAEKFHRVFPKYIKLEEE